MAIDTDPLQGTTIQDVTLASPETLTPPPAPPPRRRRRGKRDRRERPVIPGPRGWNRAEGGYAATITPPPTWRATSNQACGLWPFPLGAGIPLIGAPLGKHLLTGGTACADPISLFEAGILNAPTATVLAREGLGKSTAVRRMLLGAAAFGQLPMVFGDTKPDYVRMTQLLGGQVIVYGRGRGYQNPLDLAVVRRSVEMLRTAPDPDPEHAMALLAGLELESTTDPAEAVELVRLKRRAMEEEFWFDARGKRHTMISGLCNIRRGHPLGDVEDSVLAAALSELDDSFGGGEPVLRDLVEVINARPDRCQQAAFDEGSEPRYRQTVRPLVQTLGGLLEPHGEMGDLFARPTTEHIDVERSACFDTSSIPEDQSKLVAASLMACWQQGFSAVNARVALGLAGVLPMKHYNAVVDETWRVMLAARSGMVDRINALTRLNRQVGCSLIMAYHSILDLQAMEEEHERNKAIQFIQKSGMLLIGGLPPDEYPRLRQVREFSDKELRYLLSWQDAAPLNQAGQGVPPGRGKFLLKLGSRPGIPLHVSLTSVERDARLHETSTAWKVPSR